MTIPLLRRTEIGEADYRVAVRCVAGWLNSNDSMGGKLYMARAGLIEAWRLSGAWHARQAKVPHLARAHIIAELCFRDRRRRDVPNFYPTVKALIDGLVDAKVLDDDSSPRYLIGPDMRLGEPVKTHLGLVVLHIFALPEWTP